MSVHEILLHLQMKIHSLVPYTNFILTVKIGLDVLANAKRSGSDVDVGFKMPRERVASVVASLDEDEERSTSSGIDEGENDAKEVHRNLKARHYRESSTSKTSKRGDSSLSTSAI